jgi:small subunit ribosomal protein S6
MDMRKNLYETVFVLHPEMTEEDVEAGIQNIIEVLEKQGAEILRVDRGGKRRLAYPVRKQRYGYYNLVHFRAAPGALATLERTYRLSERVIRYLTVRFEKEEQLTGFTRLADEEGRDDEQGEHRRGGRHGDSVDLRAEDEGTRTATEPEVTTEPEVVEDPVIAERATPTVAAEDEPSGQATGQVAEGMG